MNEVTRKWAVEVMAVAIAGLPSETRERENIFRASAVAALDGLLAAGFHVAEWRDVGEAEDGNPYLLHDKSGELCIGAHFDECGEFVGDDSNFRDPTKIMDLPEPPKTDQSRGG